MPWKVVPKNGKFAVVKKGTGEAVSYHDSQNQAAAKVRAMYANTNEGGAPKPKRSNSARTTRLKNAAARRAENSGKKKPAKDAITGESVTNKFQRLKQKGVYK